MSKVLADLTLFKLDLLMLVDLEVTGQYRLDYSNFL